MGMFIHIAKEKKKKGFKWHRNYYLPEGMCSVWAS